MIIHTNQHGEFIEDKKPKQKDLKDLRFVVIQLIKMKM